MPKNSWFSISKLRYRISISVERFPVIPGLDWQLHQKADINFILESCKKKKKKKDSKQRSGFVLQVLGMRAEPKYEPGGAKHLYCRALGWSVFCCRLAALSFLLLVRRHGENKQLGSPVFISEVSALQGQKRGTKWDTAGSTVDFLVFNRHRPEELHGLREPAVEDSGKSALLALKRTHNTDIKFEETCD